jgi:hypothetical protein
MARRTNPVGDLTSRGAGTAPDLDHSETGSQRQGINNGSEPRRQRRHASHRTAVATDTSPGIAPSAGGRWAPQVVAQVTGSAAWGLLR